MKRPADQAKLLLFALLRSTATAIATTGEKARYVLPEAQTIQLRLANRRDVPSIQRCNLACLPENYNSQFYCSHLRQWPDLALVAEHVPSPEHQSNNQFPGTFSAGSNPEPKIVAYVLGKVETRPVFDYDNPIQGDSRIQTLGHVTSLAVHGDYRRLGLAKAMMTQLHYHLQHHGINSCGLHVRTSNIAACRLYQEDGYEISSTIPQYYQDGEDAYFMRKMIPPPNHISPNQSLLFPKKAWRSGPEDMRLPRWHRPTPRDDETRSSNSDPNSVSSPGMVDGNYVMW